MPITFFLKKSQIPFCRFSGVKSCISFCVSYLFHTTLCSLPPPLALAVSSLNHRLAFFVCALKCHDMNTLALHTFFTQWAMYDNGICYLI